MIWPFRHELYIRLAFSVKPAAVGVSHFKMPRSHQKGDVAVPTFHASGTGRDLYLDPSKADVGDAPRPQPLQYTDIETGERCLLRWWTRLPASGEYKTRLKRQKAMANRSVCAPTPLFTPLRCPASPACQSRACLCRFSRKRNWRWPHRLSQLPPIEKTVAKYGRSQSSLGFSTGIDRYEKVALEKFNPWSPHQSSIRNFALTYGMQKKPDRFNSKAMLAAGGFTDVLM